MAWLFSKRCRRLLSEEKIKVSIPKPVRIRIWNAIREYDEVVLRTTNTGYDYEALITDQLPGKIIAELGCEELKAWPENNEGPAGPSNLKGFVLRTYIPAQLFDALEIYYKELSDGPDKAFQYLLNQIFEESNLAWRMANGKIFPIDSTYVEEEIMQRSYQLLEEVEFQGALDEFEKARVDLTNENWEGAINNANKSVESTIKGILGIERAKPGELFRKIIESEYIPEYYSAFLSVNQHPKADSDRHFKSGHLR